MNAHRRLIRTSAALTALTLGTVTLAACGGQSAAKDDGKVDVVASFYPMQFLAEEIGGEHVSVTTLTEPGAEAHDLELTPRQTADLGQADLIVYLKGLQPAVDEAVEQSGAENVAEATSFTSLEKHGGEHGHEEGHEHGHEEGHEHGEEGHEHEGHTHELEGGEDPHVWLDPVRYAEIAEGVGKQLAEADPAHEAAYEKNTEALVAELGKLDADFEKGLANRTTDTFLTTHSAFGYLADRYGLHEESISGVDPESGSASGAHLRELQEIAEQDEVSTVFSETGSSGTAAKTLAKDLGLKTGTLSPLESAPEGEDYLSAMRDNLAALRAALGTQ